MKNYNKIKAQTMFPVDHFVTNPVFSAMMYFISLNMKVATISCLLGGLSGKIY